jgi:hypothetical protein
MGSKLEYWFLLTKIAVVVLDMMIEDSVSVGVPALDDLWWILWHAGISNRVWKLPKIRPIANLLSSKLLRWKLENPKISQLPKNLSIHPKISQFPIPSPKSNFQSSK